MPLSKKEIFYTKLNSIKTTIERSSDEQKKELITIYMANSFNELVAELSSTYPELKDSLPHTIGSSNLNKHLNLADITYLELEINAETILSLLELIGK